MPPRNPPNKSAYPPRGERVDYWTRRSERHPRVQSQPDEIVNGTNSIINALRRVRSPSPPSTTGFSRFSSRAATPDYAVPGPSSQHPAYSYPPPPVFHPPPGFIHPAYQHVPWHAPPPQSSHPPVHNPLSPPSGDGSQDCQGRCGSLFVTQVNCLCKH